MYLSLDNIVLVIVSGYMFMLSSIVKHVLIIFVEATSEKGREFLTTH